MKILVYEGISGSGKSKLLSYTKELDNYKYIQIHRFTPTQWVYDRLYDRRNVDYEEFNNNLQSITEIFVIWCWCTPREALDRQMVKREEDKTEDLEKASLLYEKYFRDISVFKNILRVDTENFSISECLIKIENFLEIGGRDGI